MASSVFEPIMIANVLVRNRFVHSATHEAMSAADGRITDRLVKRYATLAKGGVGLIIPGHFYVHPRGKAHGNQTGIHADTMVPGLEKLVAAVHRNGGKIAFQLAHGGRQSPKKVIGQPPLAPSGKGRDPVSLNKPAQMDGDHIAATIQAFVEAARRACQAGADAIQLHAAHGYLINEFLSPFFNRRKDLWGGSARGRFRFLQEIVIRIRDALSDDFPIMVKLNTDDGTPRTGITSELAASYARWLVDLDVAAIEVSCGSYYGFQTIRGDIPVAELLPGLPFWMRPFASVKMSAQRRGNRFTEAFNLAAAQVIKPVMQDVPLMLVGGLRRLDQMEELVASGAADMISISRPLIREPYLVRRFAAGKAVQASCISCNRCFAAMFNNIPIRCYQTGAPPH